MTTITREHLELAAKAAGYDVIFGKQECHAMVKDSYGTWKRWQPHEEPADAWQLAVDCDLVIDFYRHFVCKWVDGRLEIAELFKFEPSSRTAAEAVTLAASEIGRAMG